MTRMAYNASTWAKLCKTEQAMFYRAVMKLYRAIHPSKGAQSVSDHQVRHDLGLPTPLAFIRAARLSLMGRILKEPVDPLKAVLQNSAPFREQLVPHCQA